MITAEKACELNHIVKPNLSQFKAECQSLIETIGLKIENCAKNGGTSIYVSTNKMTRPQLEEVVYALFKNGYAVENCGDINTGKLGLIINW